jgi:hypothetical protein
MNATRKRLFYDIETSFCEGAFWRTGWKQNIMPFQVFKYPQIISISYKWEGEDEVHHLDWGLNKQCDKAMVKKFVKIMNSADEIIGYNSKRFDTKWVRTRAIFHDIPMRHTYNEIDVLSWVKKYTNQPTGNTLAAVCKYYNVPNKRDSGGFDTWIGVVLRKEQEALDHMHHYCDGDVISLEGLFNKLEPYARPNMHYGVKNGGFKFSCPTCGTNKVNKNNTYTTAQGTISHYMRCENHTCKTYRRTYKVNNKTYMNFLQWKTINGIK